MLLLQRHQVSAGTIPHTFPPIVGKAFCVKVGSCRRRSQVGISIPFHIFVRRWLSLLDWTWKEEVYISLYIPYIFGNISLIESRVGLSRASSSYLGLISQYGVAVVSGASPSIQYCMSAELCMQVRHTALLLYGLLLTQPAQSNMSAA